MPTYEYECKSCGHGFEVFQSMSDAPLKICPRCGREIRRLINGGTGVIFKGSGFYVTDKKAAPAAGKAAKKAGASENSAKSADAGGAACTACAKAESCPGNSGGAAENKAAG